MSIKDSKRAADAMKGKKKLYIERSKETERSMRGHEKVAEAMKGKKETVERSRETERSTRGHEKQQRS